MSTQRPTPGIRQVPLRGCAEQPAAHHTVVRASESSSSGNDSSGKSDASSSEDDLIRLETSQDDLGQSDASSDAADASHRAEQEQGVGEYQQQDYSAYPLCELVGTTRPTMAGIYKKAED